MKRPYPMIGLIACLVLAACATPATGPTPMPPTEAPTALPPTPVPTATTAPTATAAPTAVPTATLAPGEIGNAADLGLPADFVPISNDELAAKYPPKLLFAGGIEVQKMDGYPDGLIPWFQFPVKARFAFANADNTQFVHGFTVALASPEDQTSFDALLVSEFFAKMRLSVLGYTQNAAKIKNVAVGDKSVGVTSTPKVDGTDWSLNVVSFRVGDTGAFVFTLYPASAAAPIDVVKLAETYAETLK